MRSCGNIPGLSFDSDRETLTLAKGAPDNRPPTANSRVSKLLVQKVPLVLVRRRVCSQKRNYTPLTTFLGFSCVGPARLTVRGTVRQTDGRTDRQTDRQTRLKEVTVSRPRLRPQKKCNLERPDLASGTTKCRRQGGCTICESQRLEEDK